MTLFTTLYKTLIVIAIAFFFIFFYAFKMKRGNLRMEEEEKSELKEKNLELSTENPKLDEKVQELEEKNLELSTENPKLGEKVQELENKNLELSTENPKLGEKVQELEEKNLELSTENPKLGEKFQELENKNLELSTENPKLGENVQELEETSEKLDNQDPELIVKEPQLKEQEPELEQKVQELEEEKVQKEFEEEKKAKLNEKNAELKEPETEFCEPKTNVLFLKTHKTASKTLMNLFHRFAGKKHLTVAVEAHPRKVKKFHRCSIYPLKPGNEYNIFTHHTMFNYEEMKDIMPEDTTFLTILRDPAAQFESQYGYFSLENVYVMDLAAFADFDTSHPKWSTIKNLRNNGLNGLNPNCYDLGIDPELFDDEAAILGKVQELDRQFDLVMITELFNESMILMKEKLCWDELSDVVGIKTNMRRAEMKVNLSSEQKMKLREKNRADQILYDYFYEKFLRLIDAFGKERMAEEVGKLRALTEEIDELCMEYKIKGSSNNPKGKVATSFRAGAQKHEVCRAIMKNERSWEKFSKKHFAEAITCED